MHAPPKDISPEDRFQKKAGACRKASETASDVIAAEAFSEAAEWFERQARGEDPEGPYENKTIILMTYQNLYDPRIMQDASVVIDRDGYVVKNRNGKSGWIGNIEAGEKLLEEATPVFPEGDTAAAKRGREFHEKARQMGGLPPLPEEGFTLDQGWTPRQKLALTLSGIAVILGGAALAINIIWWVH